VRRYENVFSSLLVAAALAVPLLSANPARVMAADVVGKGDAVDGDTIVVAKKRFNLEGIDAPELDQRCVWPNGEIPCGDIARTALLDLVAGARVTCRPEGTDAAGETIGRCAADGFDIGGNMVHTGWRWPIAKPEKTTLISNVEPKRPNAGCGKVNSSRRGTGAPENASLRRNPYRAGRPGNCQRRHANPSSQCAAQA